MLVESNSLRVLKSSMVEVKVGEIDDFMSSVTLELDPRIELVLLVFPSARLLTSIERPIVVQISR